MRLPSPDGQTPCGSLPTGIVATFVKSLVRNTCTSLSPPTDTYAKTPFALLAKLTWLVIGPVVIVLSTVNGGWAPNTIVLPMSLSVNHTCWPSGVAAMLGQNGLSCATSPTIWCSATEITTVRGVNDEHTYPYLPSGEKICMPGPAGTLMRAFSSSVC